MHNRKLWKEAQKKHGKIQEKCLFFIMEKNAGYRRKRQYFSEFCDIKREKNVEKYRTKVR